MTVIDSMYIQVYKYIPYKLCIYRIYNGAGLYIRYRHIPRPNKYRGDRGQAQSPLEISRHRCALRSQNREPHSQSRELLQALHQPCFQVTMFRSWTHRTIAKVLKTARIGSIGSHQSSITVYRILCMIDYNSTTSSMIKQITYLECADKGYLSVYSELFN